MMSGSFISSGRGGRRPHWLIKVAGVKNLIHELTSG